MIDLKSFCHISRGYFTEPWSRGGYTYASDSKIVVRIIEVKDIPDNELSPDMTDIRLPWDHDSITDYGQLPEYDPALLKPCGFCKGLKMLAVCQECKGDGVLYFYSSAGTEYEVNCKECKEGYVHQGEDSAPCPDCDGSGINKDVGIPFSDAFLGIEYIEKMKVLPGIKISPTHRHEGPFRFIFDGGCGFVMPRKVIWKEVIE